MERQIKDIISAQLRDIDWRKEKDYHGPDPGDWTWAPVEKHDVSIDKVYDAYLAYLESHDRPIPEDEDWGLRLEANIKSIIESEWYSIEKQEAQYEYFER